MSNYLFGKVFNTFVSGVPNGKIIFEEKAVYHCRIDRKTRVQLKRDLIPPRLQNQTLQQLLTLTDYSKLHTELSAYTDCRWDTAQVKLSNGSEYSRYRTYSGTVNGTAVTAQLWAQRNSMGCLDILTVDGKVVGFSNPGRVISEVTVLEGYERISPLIKFDSDIYTKHFWGVNYLGNQMMPCRDGVRLATDVFLPYGEGAPAQVSAIVIRTCYSKEYDIDRYWPWVSRGYAVVVQDVRGRSHSEGELEPFQHEREDADDLFNWIAEQPWSNQKIGMWGASYLGYTTTSAATSGNPYLKAAVSEVDVGSPFYDTARKGGTVCSWPLLCWTLAQSVGNHVDFSIFGGITVSPTEAVLSRPITGIPEKIIGRKSGPWDLWAKHYYYDDFWKHSDNTVHGDHVKCPMLILSGWFDGDALGVQETWRFLNQYDKPGRRIVLGPWPHSLNAWRDCMDRHFGNNAVDYDFDTRILRWFDHYLRDTDNGEDRQPRAIYYVSGENEWHTSAQWPPEEVSYVKLYLSSGGHANSLNGDGTLSLMPFDTPSDSYVYDPDFPCGTEQEEGEDGLLSPYEVNSRQIRSDVLVYDTPVLTQNVAIAGPILAEIYASSTAVDTDIYVRLSDVDEKGYARNVAFAVQRAEFRNGFEVPAKLEPGEIGIFKLELNFNGLVIEKGHKIRVDICSAEAMEAFPNTNTGIDPYLDPTPIAAVNTVHHTKMHPSHISLPVLYGL